MTARIWAPRFWALAGALMAIPAVYAQASVSLSIGSGSGLAGTVVSVPVIITSSGGAQPTAVQWSFALPAGITVASVDAGPSATSAGKSLSCGATNCLVFGLNTTPIPNGAVAIANLQLAPSAAGALTISLTGVVASDINSIPATGGSGTINVTSPVANAALNALSCGGSVSTPGNVSCTVTLTAAAPSAGFTVGLSSSNASLSVPANVVVASGQTSAAFTATAVSVPADTTATITASSAGVTRTASVGLLSAPALNSLTCGPSSLNSNQSSTCTVTLDKPALAATTISLSDDSAQLTTPASVGIASGANSGTFTVSAGSITTSQTATVVASYNGVTRSAQIGLVAPAPAALSALSCSPNSFSAAGNATCTVTLVSAAAANTTVSLSDNSANVTVPGSVSVLAGQNSAQFSASAAAVTVSETATITASLNGAVTSATLTLTAPAPAALSSLSCAPTSLNSNQSATCTVTLDKASVGATTVTLSDDSTQLTTPGSVGIANGANSATFNATAGTITTTQTANIVASLNGVTRSAQMGLVAPAPAGLGSLSCSPSSFSAAGTASCIVTLVSAAPANVNVSLASSSASVTVPGVVTVPVGQSNTAFNATVASVATNTTATITAALNGGSLATTLTLTAPVTPAALSSLVCSPTSLSSNQSATCTVTLDKASTGTTTIALSDDSSQMATPGSVGIASGANSATFTVTAATVTVSQAANVSASLNGVTRTALVNLVAPAPAGLSALTCSPTSFSAAGNAACTVSLVAAAAANTTVALAGSSASVTVPGSVTVLAGQTSAQFGVTVASVATNETATITASLNGGSLATSLSLTAPSSPVALSSLVCSPSSLNSNQSATCTVTLDKASAGPATISLADDSAALTTPGSVGIAAGAASATFTVSAGTISLAQTVTLVATWNGSTRSTQVSLVPPAPAGLGTLSCTPNSFSAAGSASCIVTLATAPDSATTVSLLSGSASVTVPASVTMPQGQSNAQFTANVGAVSSAETVTITASLNGGTLATNLNLTTPAAPPAISSFVCSPTKLDSNQSSTCTVTLDKPSVGATGITLADDSAQLTTPGGITIPNGSNNGTFAVTTGNLTLTQNVTVVATLNGVSRPVQLSLTAPSPVSLNSISCSPGSFSAAGSAACTVTLTSTAATGVVVNLAVNSSRVVVPASVTIPAGQSSGQFLATVAAPSANETAIVTASSNGVSVSANLTLTAPAASASLISLSCSPASLGSNQSATCTVMLDRAGSGATVALASDRESISLAGSVTIPTGASTATFAVTAGQIASAQTATITAMLNGVTRSTQISLTPAPAPNPSPALSSFSCNPRTLTSGGSTLCVVTLTSSATVSAAVLIAGSSEAVALPSSVTVPTGGDSAQFRINVPAGVDAQQVSVTASLGEKKLVEILTITAPSSPSSTPQLSSVSCSPTSLGPGDTASCSVFLSASAESPLSLSIASGSQSLSVPARVDVSPGARSATFSASALPSLSAAETVDLTVGLGGRTVSTKLSINLGNAEPSLSSLSCAANSIPSGGATECVVVLVSAAPFPMELSLTVNKDVLQVPTRLIVQSGSTRVTFPVHAANTSAPLNVTVTAGWHGQAPLAKTLEVTPPSITVEAPRTTFVRAGVPLSFEVKASHSAGFAVGVQAPGLPQGAAFRGSRFTWTPTDEQTGEHQLLFRALDADGLAASASVRIVVRPSQAVLEGLFNPAGLTPLETCSPNAIATFLGSGFALHDPEQATVLPRPSELAGVRIRINGSYAPLLFASDGMVHFQCPSLAPGTPLELVMEYENGSNTFPGTAATAVMVTAPLRARMTDATPGIYLIEGKQGAVLINGTGMVAGPASANSRYPSRPAMVREYLEIFANGLGATTRPVATGQATPTGQLIYATGKVTAVLGEQRVEAEFAGLTPGSVGMFQINIAVPSASPTGDAVPLYLELERPDGTVVRSNSVTVAIGSGDGSIRGRSTVQ